MKLQEVRESALALPRRSREKLAQELTESVMSKEDLAILYSRGKFKNPPGSERTEAEWREEIKRRMEAYDRGEDKGIPWEEVQAEMEERINARKVSKRDQTRTDRSRAAVRKP
jgi:putative addiction module component (TIGR02574 family)